MPLLLWRAKPNVSLTVLEWLLIWACNGTNALIRMCNEVVVPEDLCLLFQRICACLKGHALLIEGLSHQRAAQHST